MSRVGSGYLPDRNRYGIWLYNEDDLLITEDGLQYHAPGVGMSPTVALEKHQAEALMTMLWSEGIRPRDWGHEGQVEALKNHLEDMRTLVFREKT